MIRAALLFVTACMAFGAWIAMFVGGEGILLSRGAGSLKYFTILSNLFAGTMSLVCLACLVFRREETRAVRLLHFMSAGAVGLTFFVVMTFLGPIIGYPPMFAGPTIYLHLFVPLLGAAEWIFFEETLMTKRDCVLAVIPTVLYGTGYLADIIAHGAYTFPNKYDWYGFMRWGLGGALVIFAVLLLVTWGIAALLRLCQNRVLAAGTRRMDNQTGRSNQ